jgi:erythromycin esterase
MDSIYNGKIEVKSRLALDNLKLGFETMYEASKKNYDVSRDYIMAEMIAKIQSGYNKKMILFAHNGHIALKPILVDGMGGYIKKNMEKAIMRWQHSQDLELTVPQKTRGL